MDSGSMNQFDGNARPSLVSNKDKGEITSSAPQVVRAMDMNKFSVNSKSKPSAVSKEEKGEITSLVSEGNGKPYLVPKKSLCDITSLGLKRKNEGIVDDEDIASSGLKRKKEDIADDKNISSSGLMRKGEDIAADDEDTIGSGLKRKSEDIAADDDEDISADDEDITSSGSEDICEDTYVVYDREPDKDEFVHSDDYYAIMARRLKRLPARDIDDEQDMDVLGSLISRIEKYKHKPGFDSALGGSFPWRG